MKIHNTIIFTGGEAPQKDRVEQVMNTIFESSFIIAADSGLTTAEKYNLTVDVLIGDMDSLPYKDSSQLQVKSLKIFPVYKDYTDTELALLEAEEHKCSSLILIGGNGGRFDHLLGIRSMYERSSVIPYPDIWFCGENLVLCLDASKRKSLTIKNLRSDDYVSIFPLFMQNTEPRLNSQGLEWDVTNLAWAQCGGSLSNKAKNNESGTEDVVLDLKTGRFLVILPLHEKSSFTVV